MKLLILLIPAIISISIKPIYQNNRSIIHLVNATYSDNCIQVGIYPLKFQMSYRVEGDYDGVVTFDMQMVDMVTHAVVDTACNGTNFTLDCETFPGQELQTGEYCPNIDQDIEDPEYIVKNVILPKYSVGVSSTQSYTKSKDYGKTISRIANYSSRLSDVIIFEFVSNLEEGSLPTLHKGSDIQVPCSSNENRLYCQIFKNTFPPLNITYNLTMKNVCDMKEFNLKLTTIGTPQIKVIEIKREDRCININKKNKFNVLYETTGELAEEDTQITSFIIRNREENYNIECNVNKHHFICEVPKDKVNETQYSFHNVYDLATDRFSVLFFNIFNQLGFNKNYVSPKSYSDINITIDYKSGNNISFDIPFTEKLTVLPQVIIYDFYEKQLKCATTGDKLNLRCYIDSGKFPSYGKRNQTSKYYYGYLVNLCGFKEFNITFEVKDSFCRFMKINVFFMLLFFCVFLF